MQDHTFRLRVLTSVSRRTFGFATTAGFALSLIGTGCVPRPSQEPPKSELNNSALRDVVTKGSEVFLEYMRKTGSTEVMRDSVSLVTSFVKAPSNSGSTGSTESTAGSDPWQTEAEWLASASTAPTPSTITCSSWFDSFLQGEQASVKVTENGTEKNYLLQFKLCESQPAPRASGAAQGFVSFLKRCASLVSKDASSPNTEWSMYRTLPIQAHALVTSRVHLQECTAWRYTIEFKNLMGLPVHYSYQRDCRLRCDESQAQGSSHSPGQLKVQGRRCAASGAQVEWTEFAEYPDAELTARMTEQGAARCNF